jgi:Fe-S-cluster containining protein
MKGLRRSAGSPGFPVSFRRFGCLQCGKCCTLTVEPAAQDIERIEMLGHRRINFLRKGNLRKVGGACIFLEKKDGLAHCKIHEMKPKVCRNYPFTVMRRDRLFSCPGLHVK